MIQNFDKIFKKGVYIFSTLIISEYLLSEEIELHNLISVKMYIQDMDHYSQLNAQYIKYFAVNPPVRTVVEVSCWNIF